MKNSKIYFASDAHFGFPDHAKSLEREKKFVKWLKLAAKDAGQIFLMGDIFDFWFEYKHVAPRGFSRLLGTIAEISDSGIPVHFFTGNHDLWVFDYLSQETGVIVHREAEIFEWNEKTFYLAHGDGLGPFDKGFKMMKKIFQNRTCQWIFQKIHPNTGIWLAKTWSQNSHYSHSEPVKNHGENEWLIQYSKMLLNDKHFDYFIYGHRHLKIDYQLAENSKVIILGDWLQNSTFGVFDGNRFELTEFE